MPGWQRHLQSFVRQAANRYDCNRIASFSTFNQAKASLVSGEISPLSSLRNSLFPTFARSPYLHMQKLEFTSSRTLLGPEGTRKAAPKGVKPALEPAWITSRQIEAGRKVLVRSARGGGKLWVRRIADKPVTMRPTETRMGRGKGNPQYSVAIVKPGRILCRKYRWCGRKYR